MNFLKNKSQNFICQNFGNIIYQEDKYKIRNNDVQDQDLLNISMLKINYKIFNSYLKEKEQDEFNILYEFNKLIVLQFLKDRSNYFKHFILGNQN